MIYKSAEDTREIYKRAMTSGDKKLLLGAGLAAGTVGAGVLAHKLLKRKKKAPAGAGSGMQFGVIEIPEAPPELRYWKTHPQGRMVPLKYETGQTLFKGGGVPTTPKKRPKVPGLKVPRVPTPRLGAGTPPGKTPANPFRGNWVKLK